MNDEDIGRLQEAIRDENLDGWLFCNFRHRDRLSDWILRRGDGLTNTRLWVYAVPARGEPLGIVHTIETDHLEGLPGKRVSYMSRQSLAEALEPLKAKRWGVHVSETLNAVSYLDAGTAAFFEKAGLVLVSAAGLVQRFQGLLDDEGIKSHERASTVLYDTVAIAWDLVQAAFRSGKSLSEGDIRAAMVQYIEEKGLIIDHPPLVAAGANSGNPHYDFSGPGSVLRKGDVVQLDLWAKEAGPAAIYGDISWVGIFAPEPSPDALRAFEDLVGVREEVFRFIEGGLGGEPALNGAMVDQKARSLLEGLGYGGALRHRTGHGIDTEGHGSGVNIDAVEFPDYRPLLEGSCFSLEPGIYFPGFGLRTEINVYIRFGKPVISQGERRQFSLLTC